MVSSEEISRRLELKRKGLNPDEKSKSQYKPQSFGNENPIGTKIICPKCQTANLETSKYCVGCGYEILKNSNVTGDEYILCSECNSKNRKDSKFCIKCGNELSKTNSTICPECKFENTTTSKFCISCGAKLGVSNEIIEETPVEKDIEEISETSVEVKEEIAEDKPKTSEESQEDEEAEYELEVEDKKADLLDKIKKAKELLDIGAISEEEYEKIKDKYLEELNQ